MPSRGRKCTTYNTQINTYHIKNTHMKTEHIQTIYTIRITNFCRESIRFLLFAFDNFSRRLEKECKVLNAKQEVLRLSIQALRLLRSGGSSLGSTELSSREEPGWGCFGP